MEEREVALLESRVRRALGSLDSVAVPSLADVRAPRRLPMWRALLAPAAAVAVLLAAVVIGTGLSSWRDALSSHGAATEPSGEPVAVDASKLPGPRYLDVAGYRFTLSLAADPAFRSSGADSAAHVSAVDGIGVHCVWDRLGPDLANVSDVIGTTDAVSSLDRYDVVTSGAHADRLVGVPAAAAQGASAVMVCGVSDQNGAHGIVANLALTGNHATPVRSLVVYQWSGVAGDPVAVAPCTGKAGPAVLIAAFVSSAAEIATWIENAAYPDAPQVRNSIFRTGYAPNAPIYVCYYAGAWAPPIGPAGTAGTATERPLTYDRARFFVDGAGVVLYPQTIAPSSQLPLVRPGGRF